MIAYFVDLKEMATGIVDKCMKKIRGDSGGSKDSNGGTYEKVHQEARYISLSVNTD